MTGTEWRAVWHNLFPGKTLKRSQQICQALHTLWLTCSELFCLSVPGHFLQQSRHPAKTGDAGEN